MNETLNIQQQEVKLERQAIRLGLEQFQKQTDKLEQGQYASATVYGASTIDNLLKVITEWIEGQRIKVQSGRNGQDFAEISQYINAISSDQLALIGLKLVIDRVCDTSNEDSAILTNVYYAVGQAIERQVQLDWYEANHKELYDYVTKKYWKPTTGTEQKYTVMRLMANRRDIHWQAWHRMSLTKLGNWVVRGICDNTKWFQVTTKQRLKKKINFLEPSPEFYLHKTEVLKVAELFTPLSYPMISEPNDWSSDAKGGYYLNEMMRGHDLVRRGDAEVLYQGAIPIAYLNNLQKVRYKINPIASEVAEWAWDQNWKISSTNLRGTKTQ
jgi:DNA-directed RNA polymerase